MYIPFFHTDYKDIYQYRSKSRPAFLLSHKDKQGSIFLKETFCELRYDLENRHHQYEIPYTDIRAILSESLTYKKKFSCTRFTIELHSYHRWLDASERLYAETLDEDISTNDVVYEEEDFVVYSSVCESKDGKPCSLRGAMSALVQRI
jgi:hypothetical protein